MPTYESSAEIRGLRLVQRLREVCQKENITFTDDGIEALVFSADGDMRNALNNLQSTVSGFGVVNKTNVEKAQTVARVVIGLGYTPLDVVTTLRGVLRRCEAELQEHLLLEFLGIVGVTHMTMAGVIAVAGFAAVAAAALCCRGSCLVVVAFASVASSLVVNLVFDGVAVDALALRCSGSSRQFYVCGKMLAQLCKVAIALRPSVKP
ncbi:hypothetical protein Emed_006762 [Eimeria media]